MVTVTVVKSSPDFDHRLQRNGVITAENPVAKAQREGAFEGGRFLELSDSDEDG